MKNISDKIDNYINNKNQALWNELNSVYEIELFYDENEYSWFVEINSKKVKIVSNELDVNIPSFTHELLHVKLDMLGMSTFEDLEYFTSSNLIFNNFIFRNLLYRTRNFHSHKKMYPYFNEMGFDDEDFVSERARFSFMSGIKLRIFKRIKYLKTIGIEQFLGNFFALKNDFVKSDKKNIDRSLKRLKNIDKELYYIADDFDTEWHNRDDYDYIKSVEIFSENLKEYLMKKYSR